MRKYILAERHKHHLPHDDAVTTFSELDHAVEAVKSRCGPIFTGGDENAKTRVDLALDQMRVEGSGYVDNDTHTIRLYTINTDAWDLTLLDFKDLDEPLIDGPPMHDIDFANLTVVNLQAVIDEPDAEPVEHRTISFLLQISSGGRDYQARIDEKDGGAYALTYQQ